MFKISFYSIFLNFWNSFSNTPNSKQGYKMPLCYTIFVKFFFSDSKRTVVVCFLFCWWYDCSCIDNVNEMFKKWIEEIIIHVKTVKSFIYIKRKIQLLNYQSKCPKHVNERHYRGCVFFSNRGTLRLVQFWEKRERVEEIFNTNFKLHFSWLH